MDPFTIFSIIVLSSSATVFTILCYHLYVSATETRNEMLQARRDQIHKNRVNFEHYNTFITDIERPVEV